MIHIICPKCAKGYNLGEDQAGAVFLCELCNREITVPQLAASQDPFAPDGRSEGLADDDSHRERRPVVSRGILAGVAVGALFIAITAGVLFAFLRQTNPGGSGVPATHHEDVAEAYKPRVAAEFLPDDAPVVVKLNLAAIWRQFAFREFFGPEYEDGSFIDMMVEHLGCRPDEWSAITIAVYPTDDHPLEESMWIAAIDLSTSIDWEARAYSGFESRTVGTETVRDALAVFDRPYSAWQPDDAFLVFGETSLVEASISRGPQPVSSELLEFTGITQSVYLAADLSKCRGLRDLLIDWGVDRSEVEGCRLASLGISEWSSASGRHKWNCNVEIQLQVPAELETLERTLEDALVGVLIKKEGEADQVMIVPRHDRVEMSFFTAGSLQDSVNEFAHAAIQSLKSSAYRLAGVEPPEDPASADTTP